MRNIIEEHFSDTGFCYSLSIISGKFKWQILYTLAEFGVVRFNEMQRYIGDISYKTLSHALKELQADDLVRREQHSPKVGYSLTERGESLIPILDQLCEWGEKNSHSCR